MDQKTKPGLSLNMIANPGKGFRGGDLPDVRGYVCKPDDIERRYNVALYTNTYADKKTGEERLYWKGKAEPFARSDSAADKFRANSARRAREAEAFRNGTAPQSRDVTLPGGGTLEEDGILIFDKLSEHKGKAANGNNKTDTYGWWNHQGVLIEIGGHMPEKGRTASIVGRTQYPLTNEQRVSMGYKPLAAQGDIQQDDSFSPISDAELEQMARDAETRDVDAGDLSGDTVIGFGEEKKPGKRGRAGR
jgi:hypothetical protein